MSEKREKISMYDASGMLSKEVLLGYVYGELSPAVRAEVEKVIGENEYYQDVIEGLRAIPDKTRLENELSDLDERIAKRAGITQRKSGFGFYEYRNVAAIAVAALLVVGSIWFTANLMTSDEAGTIAENQTKEEPIAELKKEKQQPDESESMFGSPIEEKESEDLETQSDIEEESINDVEDEPEKEVGSKQLKKEIPEVSGNIQQESKKEKQPATEKKTPVQESGAQAEDSQAGASQQEEVGENESFRSADTNTFDDAFPSRQRATETQSMIASGDQDEQTVFLFDQVEETPTFPGDQKGLITYLQQNINYPRKARRNNIEGTVFLTFVITKNGQVSQVEVIQGVDEYLDQEAKRVVEKMPPWNPGKENGKPVPVKYTLPVKFELPD